MNKRFGFILVMIGIILSIPLVAMQFTAEVNWSLFDFVVIGVLLLSAGIAIELVFRRFTQTTHRIMLGLAVLAILFLVWAELAVGVFGTPLAGS